MNLQIGIAGITTYLISLVSIPAKVEKQTNKLRSNFLWGFNCETKRVHLIRWSTMSKQLGTSCEEL